LQLNAVLRCDFLSSFLSMLTPALAPAAPPPLPAARRMHSQELEAALRAEGERKREFQEEEHKQKLEMEGKGQAGKGWACYLLKYRCFEVKTVTS
jgi:hypothetical protein